MSWVKLGFGQARRLASKYEPDRQLTDISFRLEMPKSNQQNIGLGCGQARRLTGRYEPDWKLPDRLFRLEMPNRTSII